jgi:hypothetical protein
MPVSTADTLRTVALACVAVAKSLLDLEADDPHALKKITLPGGIASFRFVQVVLVNGEPIEVQVLPLHGCHPRPVNGYRKT